MDNWKVSATRLAAVMLQFLICLSFKVRWFVSESSGQCRDEGVSRCPALRGAADQRLKQQIIMSWVFLQLCT